MASRRSCPASMSRASTSRKCSRSRLTSSSLSAVRSKTSSSEGLFQIYKQALKSKKGERLRHSRAPFRPSEGPLLALPFKSAHVDGRLFLLLTFKQSFPSWLRKCPVLDSIWFAPGIPLLERLSQVARAYPSCKVSQRTSPHMRTASLSTARNTQLTPSITFINLMQHKPELLSEISPSSVISSAPLFYRELLPLQHPT